MDGQALLERARKAVAGNAWTEAHDQLLAAEAGGVVLQGPELEMLADSAWWIGRMRDCIAYRERAHSAFRAIPDPPGAARAALRLVDHHIDMGEPAISAAWLGRAEALLRDHPEDPEHAHLNVMQALVSLQTGKLEQALEHTARAIEIAERQGDKDLLALSIAASGVCNVVGGSVDEGMRKLEEASVAAVTGDLDAMTTGAVYCMMISASSDISDWQRAGQWTEAAKRWCERQAIAGFPGVCRVHRAEVMKLRGSLSEAEAEARTAASELGGFNVTFAALAMREIGDIRLKIGDLEAAEEAFRHANEMGVSPLPGTAIVQIERGKPKAAFTSLKRRLSDEIPPTERAKLLPTFVNAALLIGELSEARGASQSLTSIADLYASPAIRAHALAAQASVALEEGDTQAASTAARAAQKLFQEVDLQFNVAEATQLLGRIYLAEDDPDAAEFELLAAQSRFEKLGAQPAAARVRDLLDRMNQTEPTNRRVAKTFLFSDIVKSTDLVGVIGDEAWMDLLAWHDQTLRDAFKRHDGEEISHTGDGFFVSFESPDDAISAAVSIQRSLADHRRRNGFAPQVRIGLHATEAAEVKGNFHGKGVHEAARIAALAGAGEIIASVSTIDMASTPPPSNEPRQVELKGVTEPVEVASIVWSAT